MVEVYGGGGEGQEVVGSRGGRGLGWGFRGQGDGVVGFLSQPPHPTTHTPLLPLTFRPLPLFMKPQLSLLHIKQHYHPPYPLTLGTPKTLDFFLKKGSISIFGHGVTFRNFNSPFHTLGVHKILKLAAIYIKVRAGQRTTASNQSS